MTASPIHSRRVALVCPPPSLRTLIPDVRFATVPDIAAAWSDAKNAAVLATSANVGSKATELLRPNHRKIWIRSKRVADAMRPDANDPNAERAELRRQGARQALDRRAGDAEAAGRYDRQPRG